MQVSDGAFAVLARLLEARTGQHLARARSWRIETALGPILKARGLSDCGALVATLAAGGDKSLATEIVNALINNETYFFRDHDAFTALIETLLDRVACTKRPGNRIRIWSAGCSTGQEPYSIAMMIAGRPGRWGNGPIDIVATDISDDAIARAREGNYSQFEIQRGLPVALMLRWFRQSGDRWIVDERLRAMVGFRTHNILDPAPPGHFDLILCRNLLLYFPIQTRRDAFDRLADAIDPAGALMLGAGETILGQTDRFEIDGEARGLYRTARQREGKLARTG